MRHTLYSVLFSGVIATPRTIGEVHFELAQEVASVKLCAALIAWNLDQFSAFRTIHHVDWVEGRNKRLLPCVKERLIGSVRRECLDWFLFLNERHLRIVAPEWAAHYNHGRLRRSLGPGIPDPPTGLLVRAQMQRHQLARDD
jgi:hypothetical protein